MGRPALSDAEKLRKGTFDKRYSQEARSVGAVTNLVAFPSLREIPACMFPLDAQGQALYDELARVLFEQGRLTVLSHAELSALAGGMTQVRKKIESGAPAPAGAFKAFLERIDKLQKASIDRAYAGSSTEGRSSKFRNSGFANRK